MWLPSQAAEDLVRQAGDHWAVPFSAILHSPRNQPWQVLPCECRAV